MLKINCVSYKNGKCKHQGAPYSLFGTDCVVANPPKDARILNGCSLQVENIRPDIKKGKSG